MRQKLARQVHFPDLSQAELAFRSFQRSPEYSVWAWKVTLAWELDNVVWFHGYANGKPVWKRELPPEEMPEQRYRDADGAEA